MPLTLVNQHPGSGVLVDEGLLPHIPQNPPLISGRILGDFTLGTTPDLTPTWWGGPGTLFDEVLGDPYFELNPPLISGRILVDSLPGYTLILDPILGYPWNPVF